LWPLRALAGGKTGSSHGRGGGENLATIREWRFCWHDRLSALATRVASGRWRSKPSIAASLRSLLPKVDIVVPDWDVCFVPQADIRLGPTSLQSGAAPTGGPPADRCMKVIVMNAPIQEPAAAKAT